MLVRLKNKKILFLVGFLLVLIISLILVWLLKYSDFFKQNIAPKVTKPATPSASPNAVITPTPASSQSYSYQPFASTPAEISWGNRNKKQVIFTFDGGSGIQSAQTILDTLEKHSVKGTFFLTGAWANKNQALTRQISQKSHEIFNHTYNHPRLTDISDTQIASEFKDTDDLIRNLTGKSTKPYFRPPYGARNPHVLDIAASQGYQSVYWTVDALDWKESSGETAEQVKNRILQKLQPGVIYLMHIGDNITGQILDSVFQQIEAQGYSIVSLSQGLK